MDALEGTAKGGGSVTFFWDVGHGGQYPGRRLTESRTGEFDMSDEADV